MFKKENIFNFDFILFLVINVFFVDSWLLSLPIIMIMLAIVIYSENINLSYIFFSAIGILILLIIAFLKLFVLIIYFEKLYKRVKNPLIIKFIESLKDSKCNIRAKWILVILSPYITCFMFEIFFNYYLLKDPLTNFLIDILTIILVSGIIPYGIFYWYLDNKSCKSGVVPVFRKNHMKKFTNTILSIVLAGIIQLINRSPNLFVPGINANIKNYIVLTNWINFVSLFLLIALFFFKFVFLYFLAKLIIKNQKLERIKNYIKETKLYKSIFQTSIFLDLLLILFYYFTTDGHFYMPIVDSISGFASDFIWVIVIMLFVSTTLTYLPFYITVKKEFEK